MNNPLSARDTIFAVSSPPPFVGETFVAGGKNSAGDEGGLLAPAARAVVRISGPEALAAAAAVFRPSPADKPSWCRIAGEVRLPQHSGRETSPASADVPCSSGPLDPLRIPACAYVMRAPYSYTREDVVELHLPALPVFLDRLAEVLSAAGARPAAAGEFTRRALLNGRISPARAEAVGALLRAETAAAARAAAGRLRTESYRRRRELRRALEELSTRLTLGLDFDPDEVEFFPRAELTARLRKLGDRAAELRRENDIGGDADDLNEDAACAVERRWNLPRAVLLGETNVGKSTLFNALLGRDVALTAPLPHTTRDTVEAVVAATPDDPAAFLLTDTAGLGDDSAGDDKAAERLRRAAQDTAANAAARADVLLLCVAVETDTARSALPELPDGIKPAAAAVVLTKSDLLERKKEEGADALHTATARAKNLCLEMSEHFPGIPTAAFVVSARQPARGEREGREEREARGAPAVGVDELRDWAAARAREIAESLRASRAMGNAVERAATVEAAAAVERAGEAAAAGLGEDVIAGELHLAARALERADGAWLSPDAWAERLLDRLFADFCIGK